MESSMGATPVYNVGGGDGFMNSWVWVFFLFFLLAWGGNGNGLFGNRNALGDYATQSDIQRGFNTNTIINKLDGISNGLCDGFYAQNTTMLQGFNGIGSAIANLGYQTQQCCCETNRNIDAVRYENSRNTCDIIQSQNANTQRILDKLCENEINSLRTDLQSAQLQISQLSQTSNIVNTLRPCPVPAYITCSPYTTANACGCGCNFA